MEFLSVVWDVNPVAFSIGSLSVRWYGIMWALGIYLCYLIQDNIYKREHHPQEWIDKLFMYMVLGSIIGARLGHCLFYEWHSCEQLGLEPIQIFAWNITYRNPYIEHPLDMLKEGVALAQAEFPRFNRQKPRHIRAAACRRIQKSGRRCIIRCVKCQDARHDSLTSFRTNVPRMPLMNEAASGVS